MSPERSSQFIGAIGTRSFVDGSLPRVAAPVIYQATGARSTVRGNAAQFLVSFGIGGAGITVETLTQGTGGSGANAGQGGVKFAA